MVKILNIAENKLLNRREALCLFPSAAGRIKRIEAVKEVAAIINTDESKVYLIKLSASAGSRDVKGIFYIYEDKEDAKKQLSPYLFTRMLSKEERKKLKEKLKKG